MSDEKNEPLDPIAETESQQEHASEVSAGASLVASQMASQTDAEVSDPVDAKAAFEVPAAVPAAPASQHVTRYISFVFLLAVIGLVGVIFYWVMARFLIPLFLAALMVVIFRPLHVWMLNRVRGRQGLAALLTTLSILLAVLVPIALLIVMAAAEGRDVLKQFNSAKILDNIQDARSRMKLDLPNANQLRNIDQWLVGMQTMEISDRSDLESQGSSLFEIEGASSVIADSQGYVAASASGSKSQQEADPPGDQDGLTDEAGDSPEADVAPAQQTVEMKWENYRDQLRQTKEMQRQLLMLQSAKNDSNVAAVDDDSAATADEFGELQAGDSGDAGDSGGDAMDALNSKLHDYRQMVDDLSLRFDAFKYALLGGRTRAFAIEILNPTDEKLQGYAALGGKFLKDQVVRFGGFAGSVLGSLLLGSAIMIISLYFFLLDGPAMLESFRGLSPLDDAHEIALADEFANVSRAVVVATLLSALAQGVLAGIGFYFVGLDSIFLLTVLSAVLAMVPFVGAAAVWVPCSVYLYFFHDNFTGAIALAIYGVAVISMVDNFIKPYVLHGASNLHPLLALLSVLGGVTTLGPIGILIGPMIVAFLQTLLKILKRELTIMDGGTEDPLAT